MSGLEGFNFQPATEVRWNYISPEAYNNNPTFFQKFGVTGPLGTDTGLDSSNSASWFGNNGILPTVFGGFQALGGVLNGITGMQQLGLANKQYNFAKNAFNAQLGNSIENYRNAAANARRVAYALQGGYARNVFGGQSQKEAGNAYGDEVTRNMTRRV